MDEDEAVRAHQAKRKNLCKRLRGEGSLSLGRVQIKSMNNLFDSSSPVGFLNYFPHFLVSDNFVRNISMLPDFHFP